mmetsp:Transcript_14164/g.34082  ORF Transcript_14164/g.34082 Transcript_14164/m.34082 type:complete len:343 (+) Transcript_14164:2401-3429(+)
MMVTHPRIMLVPAAAAASPLFLRIQLSRSSKSVISCTEVLMSGGAIITAVLVRSRNSSGSHRISTVLCALRRSSVILGMEAWYRTSLISGLVGGPLLHGRRFSISAYHLLYSLKKVPYLSIHALLNPIRPSVMLVVMSATRPLTSRSTCGCTSTLRLAAAGFTACSSARREVSVMRTSSPNFCGLACSICVRAFHHARASCSSPMQRLCAMRDVSGEVFSICDWMATASAVDTATKMLSCSAARMVPAAPNANTSTRDWNRNLARLTVLVEYLTQLTLRRNLMYRSGDSVLNPSSSGDTAKLLMRTRSRLSRDRLISPTTVAVTISTTFCRYSPMRTSAFSP